VHACPPPRPRRATAKVVTEVLHAAFSTVEVVAVSITQLAAVEVRSPRPRCVEPPAVLKVCRATAATEGLYATGHLPASSCRRCLARTEPSPPLPRASTPRPPSAFAPSSPNRPAVAAQCLHAKAVAPKPSRRCPGPPRQVRPPVPSHRRRPRPSPLHRAPHKATRPLARSKLSLAQEELPRRMPCIEMATVH
jgi:hypothetical protein